MSSKSMDTQSKTKSNLLRVLYLCYNHFLLLIIEQFSNWDINIDIMITPTQIIDHNETGTDLEKAWANDNTFHQSYSPSE